MNHFFGRLFVAALSITAANSMEVISKDLNVINDETSFTDVYNARKSVQIVSLENNPMHLNFDTQNGLKVQKREIETRLSNPQMLDGLSVQGNIEDYFLKNQNNNFGLNLIPFAFQSKGISVYCQDFKDRNPLTLKDTYHLIKNNGYGHNANIQAYENVILCFPNNACKLTLSPSSSNTNIPSMQNSDPLTNLLGGFLSNLMINHQSSDSKHLTPDLGTIFTSLELTHQGGTGFNSGWIHGNVDFKAGQFDLVTQGITINLNLVPGAEYHFKSAI